MKAALINMNKIKRRFCFDCLLESNLAALEAVIEKITKLFDKKVWKVDGRASVILLLPQKTGSIGK